MCRDRQQLCSESAGLREHELGPRRLLADQQRLFELQQPSHFVDAVRVARRVGDERRDLLVQSGCCSNNLRRTRVTGEHGFEFLERRRDRRLTLAQDAGVRTAVVRRQRQQPRSCRGRHCERADKGDGGQ